MKTIEERAKAYVNSQVNTGTQDLCRTEGYLVGATEQKEIDIQKFISLIDSLNIDKLYMESRVLSDGSRIPNQEFTTHIRKLINNI